MKDMKPDLWIGPNSGFFKEQLMKELKETGYRAEEIRMHDRAVILDERHIAMESPGGLQSTEYISSTMSGSGAAYAEKAMRRPEVRLARSTFDTIKPMRFMNAVREELEIGRTFMHEVSQGFALSSDYGTHYPQCTFRNCTPQQAYADFLLPHYLIAE
jgi:adenylosuccinate synthase